MTECRVCKGKGTRRLPAGRHEFGTEYYETFVCTACDGTGETPHALGEKAQEE